MFVPGRMADKGARGGQVGGLGWGVGGGLYEYGGYDGRC